MEQMFIYLQESLSKARADDGDVLLQRPLLAGSGSAG